MRICSCVLIVSCACVEGVRWMSEGAGRGCSVRSLKKCRTPNNNTHILLFKGFQVKRKSPWASNPADHGKKPAWTKETLWERTRKRQGCSSPGALCSFMPKAGSLPRAPAFSPIGPTRQELHAQWLIWPSDQKRQPATTSGTFDRAAGFRDQDYYKLLVPTYSKHSKQRAVWSVSVLPPHECIHTEFCEGPGLQSQAEAAQWPTALGNHTVAQKNNGPVIPLALYLDGAHYSKVGARMLVIVMVNMLIGTKHLVSTLNKRLLCRCGRRGWCTLRPLMPFLVWSLGALVTGAFLSTQYEGWSEEE